MQKVASEPDEERHSYLVVSRTFRERPLLRKRGRQDLLSVKKVVPRMKRPLRKKQRAFFVQQELPLHFP